MTCPNTTRTMPMPLATSTHCSRVATVGSRAAGWAVVNRTVADSCIGSRLFVKEAVILRIVHAAHLTRRRNRPRARKHCRRFSLCHWELSPCVHSLTDKGLGDTFPAQIMVGTGRTPH